MSYALPSPTAIASGSQPHRYGLDPGRGGVAERHENAIPPNVGGPTGWPAWFGSALVLGMLVPFLGVAMFLAWRRAVASDLMPPTVGIFVTLVFVGAATSVGVFHGGHPRESRERSIFWLAWTAGWALLAVAVTLPGASLLGVAIFWAAVGGLACFAVTTAWAQGVRDRSARLDCINGNATPTEDRIASWRVVGPSRSSDDDESDTLPADVEQEFERGVSASGGVYVRGKLRVALPAGQRNVYAHLVFCPPIVPPLSMHAEVLEGPDAQVATGAVLPQGTRFDVRLATAPAEDTQLVLGFFGEADVP